MKTIALLLGKENFYNFNINFEGFNIAVTMPKDFFCEELGTTGIVHNHIGYELHYVTYGKIKAYVQGENIVLNKGDYTFIAPGIPHVITSLNGCRTTRCRLRITIDKYPDECDRGNLKDSVLYDFITKGFRSIYTGYSKDIYQCFKNIYDEINNNSLLSNCIIENNLNNIIVYILRNIYKSPSTRKTKSINLDDERINIIDAYFINNFYKPDISKNELARILCISVRQLERIILSNYGQTFMDKLIQMRIEQAKYLILNTDINLEDISFQVGFASVDYFRRVFKKKTGLSPTNYRKIMSYKTGKEPSTSLS